MTNVREPAIMDWRATLRRRTIVAAVFLGLWMVGIECRLVFLQVVRHADLVARASRQQSRTMDAAAKRGDILDRRGRVLATSVDADSVIAVPSAIEDPPAVVAALCGALGDCKPAEREALIGKLGKTRAFAYVRRQASPEQARRVAALNLEGIGFMKEDRRFYPNKELAAHLLGYVGIDNTGLSGLESTYDAQIRGKAGTVLVQTDARRHAFSRVERPPTAGSSVELTIDEYLQHIAERELEAGVAENRAKGGSAIIMNPHTGEILAMANVADVQSQRLSRLRRIRAAQPRRSGSLRAGLDVQGRHGVGGHRREHHAGRHADRHEPRRASAIRGRAQVDYRSEPSQLRHAVVRPTSSSSRATSARSRSASRSAPIG